MLSGKISEHVWEYRNRHGRKRTVGYGIISAVDVFIGNFKRPRQFLDIRYYLLSFDVHRLEVAALAIIRSLHLLDDQIGITLEYQYNMTSVSCFCLSTLIHPIHV